jgi:fluoroacetyl-CoA thioesterase
MQTAASPSSGIRMGMTGSFTLDVTHEQSAAHLHPDLPEVLGTPFLVYAVEMAAGLAIAPHLPAGTISVGASVSLTHLAATPMGFRLVARAEVIAIEEKTVTFRVEAHDDLDKVTEGTHVRALIRPDRFTQRLEEKKLRRAAG